jgi:hypothetical protein
MEAEMNRSIAKLTGLIAFVILLAPLLAANQGQVPERSRTQGLKETDEFVKAGGTMVQKLVEGKNQVKTTLDAYNALVSQPSKDMKGDYKKMLKSSDSMNDKLVEARQKVAEMQKAGDTYFSGRAQTVKGIQDSQLQTQAQQRLEANQKEFAAVEQEMREAGSALEPFRKQLADQVTYLGGELTPSAAASVKPQADKLNAQGAEVFSKADKAIAHANSYFQSLRAQS